MRRASLHSLFVMAVTSLALASGEGSLRAQAELYISKRLPATIYRVNRATGQAIVARTSLPETYVALARHPQTNVCYCMANGGSNAIFTWDPATDAVTYVDPVGQNTQAHRWAFSAEGRLFGVPLNSKALFEWDPVTGAKMFINNISGLGSGGATGDMAFAPGATANDEFYYAVDAKVYRVPMSTLSAQLVGSAGTGADIEGLGFDETGRLWANTANDIWEIDTTTGVAAHVGPTLVGKTNDMAGALPPLFLDITPNAVIVSQTVTIEIKKGAVGAPVGLVATEVNGLPTFQLTRVMQFNQNGEVVLSGAPGSALAGLDMDLAAMGFTTFGDLVLTNTQNLTIQ